MIRGIPQCDVRESRDGSITTFVTVPADIQQSSADDRVSPQGHMVSTVIAHGRLESINTKMTRHGLLPWLSQV
jgi:hypothetical protein